MDAQPATANQRTWACRSAVPRRCRTTIDPIPASATPKRRRFPAPSNAPYTAGTPSLGLPGSSETAERPQDAPAAPITIETKATVATHGTTRNRRATSCPSGNNNGRRATRTRLGTFNHVAAHPPPPDKGQDGRPATNPPRPEPPKQAPPEHA